MYEVIRKLSLFFSARYILKPSRLSLQTIDMHTMVAQYIVNRKTNKHHRIDIAFLICPWV